ncbi:MAG TPA: hypothetical protein VEG30_09800 [Terriglobales bacterium]|nr:hypothetical protein [Terriglobales bacterium]
MKKSLVTLMVAFAIAVWGEPFPPQAAAPAQGTPAQGAPAQKKEIKDPAEYNAYMAAIQAPDNNQRASALEAFVTQYPRSVMKEDALELLMRTYQQLNNGPKTADAAQRVLQVNPNNVTALAILSYTDRIQAQSVGGPNAAQLLADASRYGQTGLQALQTYTKPENLSDADFAKLKDQLAGIFNASVGINALQTKDYPTAQKALSAAAQANPNDFSIVYPLALAQLQAPQPDYINGLWSAARAATIAPTPQLKQQITEYGRRMYIKYHGGDDGWTDVLAAAQASPAPPANFAIKPAPTPAEQADKLLGSKPVDQMSFDEFQLILTSGNQAAADKLWTQIKDKPLAIEGKLVSATPTKLMIAGSYDDIQANPPVADIELTMTATIPTRLMPKEGTTIQFQGNPTTWDPKPFLVHMEKGVLLTKAAPTPTPSHKPPARRTPSH